jgi:hypothetical protein
LIFTTTWSNKSNNQKMEISCTKSKAKSNIPNKHIEMWKMPTNTSN